MDKKIISVIVPTYNRGDRLFDCINSIISQDYELIEIIIVNDGEAFSNHFLDKLVVESNISIVIIENKYNMGACLSRNIGIIRAKGFYITLCDDDDLFKPNRLSSLLNKYEKSSNKGVFSDTYVKSNSSEKITKLPNFINLNKILYGNYAGAQIFSEASLMKNILFDRRFVASQDHDFNTRFIQQYGELVKTDHPTYVSVQHNDFNRVSNQVLIGRLQYYLKFKKIMSFKHKISFWFKISFKYLFK